METQPLIERVMVQFRLPDGPVTLASAASRLGVPPSRLDPDFGVVSTDLTDRLFTVMLDADSSDAVATRLAKAPSGAKSDPAEGVFANPRIEPFGPPG